MDDFTEKIMRGLFEKKMSSLLALHMPYSTQKINTASQFPPPFVYIIHSINRSNRLALLKPDFCHASEYRFSNDYCLFLNREGLGTNV